jgi:hypothetical protein
LIIFLVTPKTFGAVLVRSEVATWSVLLSGVTLLCNGPVGDLLVLLATPLLLKNIDIKS